MKNKVVIVTGAARGLGQKYAIELSNAGALVVAADINSCEETKKLIEEKGSDCLSIELDVTNYNSCEDLVAKTLQNYKKIDVLVNNAALYGTLKSSRFEDIDPKQWDQAMSVNVKGVWNCCRAVVPTMRKQKSGSIINIASLAAIYGMPYAADYDGNPYGKNDRGHDSKGLKVEKAVKMIISAIKNNKREVLVIPIFSMLMFASLLSRFLPGLAAIVARNFDEDKQ